MLMMVTCSEDGDIRLSFYRDQDEMLAQFAADEQAPPSIFLTAEQAREDPNYWPSGSAFLAEVTPLRLEAEQVEVRWRAVPHRG